MKIRHKKNEFFICSNSNMPRKLSLNETNKFHHNKHKIGKIVIDMMDKQEVVYGARALNQRFPKHLDRHTRDFDIFTPTPKKDARETERALDKAFGGDFFFVEPAEHPGTWKVIAHATGDTYVDYTKPDKKIPFDVIGGKNFIKLGFVKKSLKKTLGDKSACHRHPKDRDALNRIKIFERGKKR